LQLVAVEKLDRKNLIAAKPRAETSEMNADIGASAAKVPFVRILPVHASCSEEPLCRFFEGKKFLTALFCTQPESTPH
jgi:hypothetical protein